MSLYFFKGGIKKTEGEQTTHPAKTFEAFTQENHIEPETAVFVFPSNNTHHISHTLYSLKSGAKLADIAEHLGNKGYPVLGLPTTDFRSDQQKQQKPFKEIGEEAMVDLWKAAGFGMHIVFPVRNHVPDGQLQDKNEPESADNPKIKYFSKPLDGTKLELSFWGGVEKTPNTPLGDYYIEQLNTLNKCLKTPNFDPANPPAGLNIDPRFIAAYQAGQKAKDDLTKGIAVDPWFKKSVPLNPVNTNNISSTTQSEAKPILTEPTEVKSIPAPKPIPLPTPIPKVQNIDGNKENEKDGQDGKILEETTKPPQTEPKSEQPVPQSGIFYMKESLFKHATDDLNLKMPIPVDPKTEPKFNFATHLEARKETIKASIDNINNAQGENAIKDFYNEHNVSLEKTKDKDHTYQYIVDGEVAIDCEEITTKSQNEEPDTSTISMNIHIGAQENLVLAVKEAKRIAVNTNNSTFIIGNVNANNKKEALEIYSLAMASGLRPVITQDNKIKEDVELNKTYKLLQEYRDKIYKEDGSQIDNTKTRNLIDEYRKLIIKEPEPKQKLTM